MKLPTPFKPPDFKALRAARARIQQALAAAGQFYALADKTSGGLLKRMVRALMTFNDRDTRLAASIAYYGLFSIFPLLLLAVAAFSAVVGPAIAEQGVIRLAESFLPGETLNLITSNLSLALEQLQSVSIIAGIGLLWASLSLFSNLSFAIDLIFHPTRQRPMWRQRILAVGITVILALLILASIVTSTLLRLIGVLLLDRTTEFLSFTAVFLPLGINVTGFALLYRLLPRMVVRWDAVWPAALITGIGWELLKNLFVWFLENLANFSTIYGSVGAVLVLLIWTYLTASLILLGAEICAELNAWLAERELRRTGTLPPGQP